ncbi:EAL domain-containing protein [Tepidimonas aquatica]|uniref:EAL domain-containing protein n=1 Tax=Tepidimonas aquatica TaxID=247482 RepID=UPI001FE354BC|nr:EAL domain-containing protein [Tepidimonas aquatica]
MLGRRWVLLTLLATLVCGPAHARWLPEALMRHSVPAWVIDPADGTILDANAAAVELYGYPDMALGHVNIQQINQLSEAEIRAEMARAHQEKRGYFLFPHRLASGEVVTVEVHSSPIPGPQGRILLLSLLLPESRSVTLGRELQRYQTRLEDLVAQRTDQLLSAERKRARMLMMALGVSALATLVLLVLLRQLRLGNQRQRELATQLQDVLRGARLGLAQWDLQRDHIALNDRLGRLLYLKRLPANVVKIDQSFVRDVFVDPSDLRIIEGIVALGHAFSLQVVGEGVETLEHGTLLLRLGVDVAQGWGIARAMPVDTWTSWVRHWQAPQQWLHWAPLARSPWSRALAQVEIEHRIVMARALMGEPVPQHERCPVTELLDPILPRGAKSWPEVVNLHQAHEAFHRVANQAAAQRRQPSNTMTRDALQQGHAAWIAALEALQERLAQPLAASE